MLALLADKRMGVLSLSLSLPMLSTQGQGGAAAVSRRALMPPMVSSDLRRGFLRFWSPSFGKPSFIVVGGSLGAVGSGAVDQRASTV